MTAASRARRYVTRRRCEGPRACVGERGRGTEHQWVGPQRRQRHGEEGICRASGGRGGEWWGPIHAAYHLAAAAGAGTDGRRRSRQVRYPCLPFAVNDVVWGGCLRPLRCSSPPTPGVCALHTCTLHSCSGLMRRTESIRHGSGTAALPVAGYLPQLRQQLECRPFFPLFSTLGVRSCFLASVPQVYGGFVRPDKQPACVLTTVRQFQLLSL